MTLLPKVLLMDIIALPGKAFDQIKQHTSWLSWVLLSNVLLSLARVDQRSLQESLSQAKAAQLNPIDALRYE